jgi:hypothetical protein
VRRLVLVFADKDVLVGVCVWMAKLWHKLALSPTIPTLLLLLLLLLTPPRPPMSLGIFGSDTHAVSTDAVKVESVAVEPVSADSLMTDLSRQFVIR